MDLCSTALWSRGWTLHDASHRRQPFGKPLSKVPGALNLDQVVLATHTSVTRLDPALKTNAQCSGDSSANTQWLVSSPHTLHQTYLFGLGVAPCGTPSSKGLLCATPCTTFMECLAQLVTSRTQRNAGPTLNASVKVRCASLNSGVQKLRRGSSFFLMSCSCRARYDTTWHRQAERQAQRCAIHTK